MNNINKTSKDIKKKLSLNDYSVPSNQQRQTSKELSRPTIKKFDEKVIIQKGKQQTVLPATADCQNSKHVCKHEMVPKIKSTYYLTTEANRQMTEVYINRLKNDKKTDRSTLICEAIALLYRSEF